MVVIELFCKLGVGGLWAIDFSVVKSKGAKIAGVVKRAGHYARRVDLAAAPRPSKRRPSATEMRRRGAPCAMAMQGAA